MSRVAVGWIAGIVAVVLILFAIGSMVPRSGPVGADGMPAEPVSAIPWAMILSGLGGGSLMTSIAAFLSKAVPTIPSFGIPIVDKTSKDTIELSAAVAAYLDSKKAGAVPNPGAVKRVVIAMLSELGDLFSAYPPVQIALSVLTNVIMSVFFPLPKIAPDVKVG